MRVVCSRYHALSTPKHTIQSCTIFLIQEMVAVNGSMKSRRRAFALVARLGFEPRTSESEAEVLTD